ncbi:MAG TPA: DUF6582 domain-containing protein [Candidatus Dormibacteraeota bacterium]|jgi:hypothetical protein|nr:DUF6582 domain-containing protein [Candidatus Dormibacteraeota bacterium]
MATEKQRTAARQNIKKAQASNRGSATTDSGGMSTRKRESLGTSTFAFPKERKEPLNDASHVRNAVARFDQVEGVSDEERDQAWRRIKSAAKKHGVEVEAKSWRELTR